jgi:hypothetical protein
VTAFVRKTHFFLLVFWDALIAAAVGAPFAPTGRIRSPEPASMRFFFALMLCQRPFFPFGFVIFVGVVFADIGDCCLGAFVFLLVVRIHNQSSVNDSAKEQRSSIKYAVKATITKHKHNAGGNQNGASSQTNEEKFIYFFPYGEAIYLKTAPH